MPRYFLNVLNGTGYVADDEGRDLPDLAGARREAIDGIRSIISEEARRGTLDLGGRVEIVDERGEIVLSIPFHEAFAPEEPRP